MLASAVNRSSVREVTKGVEAMVVESAGIVTGKREPTDKCAEIVNGKREPTVKSAGLVDGKREPTEEWAGIVNGKREPTVKSAGLVDGKREPTEERAGIVNGKLEPTVKSAGLVDGKREPTEERAGIVNGKREPTVKNAGLVDGKREPTAESAGLVNGKRDPAEEWAGTPRRNSKDIVNNNVFPHRMCDVEPSQAAELMQYFTGELTGFVRVGREGYFLPHKYKQEAQHIYNMELRSDDVFVASYPRSGTTWTQELVWMVANDLDYAGSAAVPLVERYPFLEFSVFVHPEMKRRFAAENSGSAEKLQLLEAVTAPGWRQLALAPRHRRRFVKTHLPLSLLPPGLLDTARVVYVARDPRDVAVSFYHLNRLIRTQGYVGDFNTYWRYFKNHWTPYFAHLKEAWQQRHHPNLLFLFYEELSKDLPGAVRRVSSFLGKKYSEEQVHELCRHLDISSFRNNKSVNYDVMKELGILISGEQAFIRKGVAGGWRAYFDEETTAEAQRWMNEHLAHTDMRFPHL